MADERKPKIPTAEEMRERTEAEEIKFATVRGYWRPLRDDLCRHELADLDFQRRVYVKLLRLTAAAAISIILGVVNLIMILLAR